MLDEQPYLWSDKYRMLWTMVPLRTKARTGLRAGARARRRPRSDGACPQTPALVYPSRKELRLRKCPLPERYR